MRALTLMLALTVASSACGDDDRAARAKAWEPEFQAVEARRKREKPPLDAPVFLGSSSFRLWDTAEAFPELRPYNAGFGGSHLRDVTQSLARLLGDAKPRFALVYAGDNDIAAGRSAEVVRADFAELVGELRAKFPGLPVLFVAVKPSPARAGQFATQTEANRLVREFCAADPALRYLDAATPLLDAAGRPRRELYRPDKLHLSAKGYEIWAKQLRDALKGWPAAK